MFPRVLALCIASVLLIQCARQLPQPPAPAQLLPLDPLTSQEKQLAERVARADPRVRELIGTRHRLSYIEFFAVKPADEASTREGPQAPLPMPRHAEVVFYRFDGDFGVRALVALRPQPSVAEVQRIDSANVPLNNEDLAEARQLALQNIELRRVLGEAVDRYRVEGLRILATEEGDPCFRHRCLQLLFRLGDVYLSDPEVVVDVTSQAVRLRRTR